MKLANGKIGSQELLMNTTKETHEVADEGPHAFNGVDMDFSNAISIVIACPFFKGMTDGVVRTVQVVVALPFIRVNLSALLREGFTMGGQPLTAVMVDDA